MLIRLPPKFSGYSEVIKYLTTDLWTWFRELATGLLALTFQDNFDSFEVTGLTIPAGQQVEIVNQFNNRTPASLPSKYIITMQSGNGLVTMGAPWTLNVLTLLNNGAVDVTINVTFFK